MFSFPGSQRGLFFFFFFFFLCRGSLWVRSGALPARSPAPLPVFGGGFWRNAGLRASVPGFGGLCPSPGLFDRRPSVASASVVSGPCSGTRGRRTPRPAGVPQRHRAVPARGGVSLESQSISPVFRRVSGFFVFRESAKILCLLRGVCRKAWDFRFFRESVGRSQDCWLFRANSPRSEAALPAPAREAKQPW